MEEEVEAKQQYLREEIIDKGYDPEVFSKYIIDLKGEDGFDLENWTMNELAALVKDFKKHINNENKEDSQQFNNYPQLEQNQEIEAKEEEYTTQKSSQVVSHKRTSFFDDEPKANAPQQVTQQETIQITEQTTTQQNTEQEALNDISAPKGATKSITGTASPIPMEKANNPFDDSNEVVGCNKAEKTILTDMSKLKVEISNPELIKNGIFSFAFLQFTIATEVTNKVTTRKLADFEWFYYKLLEMFPGVCIPSFPLKKMFEKKNDAKFHMKKQYYLQKFINALIKTKIIRTSKIFFDFITQSKEEWKDTRLALEKTAGPANMSKFTTMEGIINISITKDLDIKALSIQRDINTKIYLYQKVNSALNATINQMGLMSQCFLDLSTAYKELSKGFNESIFKNEFLEKGYNKLGTLTNDWSEGYTKQRDFFKTELKYYFKFMKKELNCFSFLIDDYKTSKAKYFDYFNKMSKVTFLNNQQNADMSSLKKYYGFFMNRAINEYYRLQKNHMKRLKLHFDTLTDRRSEFIVDYMSFIQLVSFNL